MSNCVPLLDSAIAVNTHKVKLHAGTERQKHMLLAANRDNDSLRKLGHQDNPGTGVHSSITKSDLHSILS
jgi:hypothetical protein